MLSQGSLELRSSDKHCGVIVKIKAKITPFLMSHTQKHKLGLFCLNITLLILSPFITTLMVWWVVSILILIL
mgnify:CR=1 FL=1